MSIQSTREITRDSAINRINFVNLCILTRNYKALDEQSFETDHDVADFINSTWAPEDVTNWTTRMLEDLMDAPFYRFSMFDNYFVED